MAQNLKIYKNGEDISGKGIRDTEAILQEHLPDLTSSLLNSVIVLGQGLPQRFTNNTPSGRKEVLEKLSKSDFMIEDLKSRIDARQKVLNDNMLAIQKEVVKIQTTQQLKNSALQEAKSSLSNLQDISVVEAELSTIITKRNEVESTIKQLEADQQADLTRYEELDQRYLDIQAQNSAEVQNLRDNCDAEIQAQQTPRQTKLQEYYAVQAKITALKAEIARLNNITDVCPTCGQKLPNVTKIDTTDKKAELTNLQNDSTAKYSAVQAFDVEIENIKNKYKCLVADMQARQATTTKATLDELTTIRNKRAALTASLATKNAELIRLSTEISTKQNIIDSYAANKQRIETAITTITDELTKLDGQLLYNNNELTSAKNRLEVISKFSTAVKRDFRGYLLASVINYIDTKAKEYCKDIFNNQNIEFKLDGNNILISYNNKPYEALSGGERQKIDLIIQFAIRDMLCTYLNFSSNILVLDEIFDNMDMTGCDKTVNFITNKLCDINSVFIVSHRADLKIPYDKNLCIVKNENGISNVLQ